MESYTEDKKIMIFSSGGETSKCLEGCIAVYIQRGTLKAEVRIRKFGRQWNDKWYCGETIVPFATWFHLTVAWNNASLRTFVNGEPKQEGQVDRYRGSSLSDVATTLMYLATAYVKRDIDYGAFDIDEWLFYDDTITDQEVSDFYASEL